MTDQEVIEIWSKMKVGHGHPEGILSRPNVMEIVRRTFPRLAVFCLVLMRNIYDSLIEGVMPTWF